MLPTEINTCRQYSLYLSAACKNVQYNTLFTYTGEQISECVRFENSHSLLILRIWRLFSRLVVCDQVKISSGLGDTGKREHTSPIHIHF